MPLATINAVAPQRNTLETSVTAVHAALTLFSSTYYSGGPAPAELTRLIAEGASILTDITNLGTGHTHESISALDNRVIKFRNDIDNAQSLFAGHIAEWKTDVMTPAEEAEKRSGEFISEASGSWIRRKTRNGLEKTLVLNAHNRGELRKFVKRHKGKIAGTVGAGAVLYGVLHMDGLTNSSSDKMPPTGNTSSASGKFIPVNKQGSTTKEGEKYDGNGKNFSVSGFINASKTVFPNGASPSAQAFQGVWNYIAANSKDLKNGFGKQYHFHTTPDGTSTHYDISAYTGPHDTEILDVTWQMDDATNNGLVTKDGTEKEQLNNHTRRFTLNNNGTISFSDVYSNGKIEPRGDSISAEEFRANLQDLPGF